MSHNYIFLENWPWCVKKVPYVDAAEVKIMKRLERIQSNIKCK